MSLSSTNTATFRAEVDLTSCDREPIHIPGQIQSFGVLLSVTGDMTVNYASSNLSDVLGIGADAALGQQLVDILPNSTVHDLRTRLQLVNINGGQSRLFGYDLLDDGRLFDVSIHVSDQNYVFEFEPKQESEPRDEMALVNPLIARTRRKQTVVAASQEATLALKMLTGFDRVMVYQFADDGTGEIIAESCNYGMAPYLGLRYPASDIPKQARELYKRTLLRLIHDVDAPVCDLLASPEEGKTPLDLSSAVTRAVSPIHLEYLRNMGVRATMAVSIIINDELWGMIVCHHGSPHYIDYERRTVFELFGQFFSYEIAMKAESAIRRDEARAKEFQDQLTRGLAAHSDLLEGFDSIASEMPYILPCDGVAVCSDGQIKVSGHVPDEKHIEALLGHVMAAEGDAIFETSRIVDIYPEAESFSSKAAGMLSIPVSRSTRDYVLLFRREIARSVTWAGNPEKPAEPGPNGLRLTPRKSFDAWTEIVRHSCQPWSQSEIAKAEQVRIALVETLLRLTEETSELRRRLGERQEFLIAELNHRVRNILNLIQGLVSQTKESASDITSYTSVLDGRVQALARAHDQLTLREWEPSPLRDLIDVEVNAYSRGATGQVRITGDHPVMAAAAFSSMALVVHELTTNSVKYGALSLEGGQLDIHLSIADSGDLHISWRESGGPKVSPPERQGFGTTVVERTIPFELGGTVDLRFAEEGVAVDMMVPAKFVGLQNMKERDRANARKAPAAKDLRLQGKVLVVEDNMIIALDSADTLRENGAEEVISVATANAALDAIDNHDFSFALLDVNLGGKNSLPVANDLQTRGIPFVIATGYGSAGSILESYPPAPILRKPFTSEALLDAISRALNPA